MTSSSVRRILSFIRAHDHFLCSGHVRSDGDALGSQLAFDRMLRRMGKRSHVVCDRGAAAELRFLPGAHRVGADPSDLRRGYSAVFTFDSGAWSRLERIAAALPRAELTVVNIDHHASNDRFGDLNWIDDSFSSTAEMVWEIVKASGVKADRGLATCVYTGIVTDTGRFSFSNTTVRTHRTAAELIALGVRPAEVTSALYRQKTPAHLKFLAEALRAIRVSGRVGWITITGAMCRAAGFVPGDTQEYIDAVKSLKAVHVAVLFREQDGKVKISFRTAPGIDGVELASQWGGGGHRRASGATVAGRLRAVEREVIARTIGFVKNGQR